jgi:hypothetical protein
VPGTEDKSSVPGTEEKSCVPGTEEKSIGFTGDGGACDGASRASHSRGGSVLRAGPLIAAATPTCYRRGGTRRFCLRGELSQNGLLHSPPPRARSAFDASSGNAQHDDPRGCRAVYSRVCVRSRRNGGSYRCGEFSDYCTADNCSSFAMPDCGKDPRNCRTNPAATKNNPE